MFPTDHSYGQPREPTGKSVTAVDLEWLSVTFYGTVAVEVVCRIVDDMIMEADGAIAGPDG